MAAAFTTEHVRNLAEVAGSPTLEARLRRAAAEQLREVLLSRGVASAVCREVIEAKGRGVGGGWGWEYSWHMHATDIDRLTSHLRRGEQRGGGGG